MGLVIAGFKFDDPGEFLISAIHLLQLQARHRQLVMGRGKVRICLDGVVELDDGFVILALLEVPLAALVILLFADVRVPRTSDQGTANQCQDQGKTKRQPHCRFSKEYAPHSAARGSRKEHKDTTAILRPDFAGQWLVAEYDPASRSWYSGHGSNRAPGAISSRCQ